MSASDRLRELREAKHLSQEGFGALAGVSKNTQNNYETGKRQPTFAYLEALAAAGVDVVYLLTGDRDLQLLTDRQRRILRLFDALSEDGQTNLIRGLEAGRPGRIARGEDRLIREGKENQVKPSFKPIGGDNDKR